MNAGTRASVLVLAAAVASSAPAEERSPVPSPSVADLVGAWSGSMSHDGEDQPLGLELEPATDGKVLMKLSVPAVRLASQPIGSAPPQVQGNVVTLGPLRFTYDGKQGTLSGVMPEVLVPVYRVPFTLHRVARIDFPREPEPTVPLAKPAWVFVAGSPLWAGPTFADGAVYAGGEDGRLHALDARTGNERWSFRAGGPIRTRATVDGGDVYFQADDGFLYKLSAASGEERLRLQVVEKPIERLPFDNPRSHFDRFGSDVTVAGGRLHLGTHDGRVLALEPVHGGRVWEFAAGDSVLAAPAVDSGRVYFGSHDHFVYALDAGTGRLLWKRDTQGAVVSTPAVADDRVVVGNRCYDLLALDAATGEVDWKRYIWSSWVESSATIRDGVAYVGSSDAASVFAFDVRTGRRLWGADVQGWAWGRPAVTDARVYACTASQVGYLASHRAGVMALDRASGRPVWRYAMEPSKAGAFGFPGSAAVGIGLVYVTGLDGRVYAFPE
jgi:outer membrane protein assembly factor BamB